MVLPQTNFHNRHSHTMEIECSSVWCGCEWNEDAAHTHIAEQKALVSIHCLFTHTHTQLKHNFVKQKQKNREMRMNFICGWEQSNIVCTSQMYTIQNSNVCTVCTSIHSNTHYTHFTSIRLFYIHYVWILWYDDDDEQRICMAEWRKYVIFSRVNETIQKLRFNFNNTRIRNN